ncbi:Bgt-3064 [Blumeria graminis f. sp. tritici]|uniref:NAD(+) diphosphatase n=2 Tax=Blumeria graminis f. sp. tritici TaxID=62690 RepID=A0A381L9X4_BLUGR|nr:NADH diphosphatase [Blumeria graminis f. sp. tritici 96224]VCU40472.1 Bgt-3064 [Blumeria graminis f. sp. tritici]
MAPSKLLPAANYSLDSIFWPKTNTANYFSGNPLNRVSFLRADHDFLSSALTHPSASFLLLNDLAPLARDPSTLAYTTLDDIRDLVGDNPFSKSEEELIAEYDSSITLPLMLFLGIDERKQEGFEYGLFKGKPYFSVDITPKGTIERQALGIIDKMKSRNLCFLEGRTHVMLSAAEAAMYAQARALTDWNARNPFCAACGKPTLAVNAGMKRTCPSTDRAPSPTALKTAKDQRSPQPRPPCRTRNGISNLSFPRTDPVVIMAVISHNYDRILLGRQRFWPPKLYSTLAGFVEPGESIEEAVRREVWEESGVQIGKVMIHSSQPWPYPASLMIGAIAQALPDGETIHLEHDPELEDAQWLGLEEITVALDSSTNGLGELGEGTEGCGLKVPPRTAISNQLLRAAVVALSAIGNI